MLTGAERSYDDPSMSKTSRPVSQLAAVATLLVTTQAVAQAPMPPPVQPPLAAPAAAAGPSTYVWIETTDPHVSLERRIGSLEKPSIGTGLAEPGSAPGAYGASSSYGAYWEPDWERVCVTPCQMPVATGGVYRIAGEGITPSEGFPVTAGRMKLDVTPGSASAKSVGAYMAVFGFILAAAGGVFLGTAVVSDEEDTGSENKVFGAVGAAGLIGGGVLGIIGVILVVANGTEVRTEGGKVIGGHPRSPGSPSQAGSAFAAARASSLNAVGTF
jgi:hypothetical protein